MVEFKVPGEYNCWFWHKWEILYNTRSTEYLICIKCQTRLVKQHNSNYNEIDWDWLDGETHIPRGMKE